MRWRPSLSVGLVSSLLLLACRSRSGREQAGPAAGSHLTQGRFEVELDRCLGRVCLDGRPSTPVTCVCPEDREAGLPYLLNATRELYGIDLNADPRFVRWETFDLTASVASPSGRKLEPAERILVASAQTLKRWDDGRLMDDRNRQACRQEIARYSVGLAPPAGGKGATSWCSEFASYLYFAANLPRRGTDDASRCCENVEQLRETFEREDRFLEFRKGVPRDRYVPKLGDYVPVEWGHGLYHSAVVLGAPRDAEGRWLGWVLVIQGNVSNGADCSRVHLGRIDMSDPYVRGVGIINYDAGRSGMKPR